MRVRAGDLDKALSVITRMVESRNTIQILSNVLLEPNDGGLAVSVHNLDACGTSHVAAEGSDLTATTVSAVRFAGLVRALPRDAMIELVMVDDRLGVNCGRARYRLETLAAEGFPPRLSAEGGVTFTLDADAIERLFRLPTFAISTEETRYYLNGLYLRRQVDGHRIEAVATDGHRLMLTFSPAKVLEWPANVEGAIIPRKFVDQIVRLDGDVMFQLSDRCIEASAGSTVVVSKLIDGSYPDYARIIPAVADSGFEADRADLIAVVARLNAICVSVGTKGGGAERRLGRGVVITWGDGEVVLTLAGMRDDAHDVVPAAMCGGSGKFGVSLKYFGEILDALPGKRVCIDSEAEHTAARFTVPGDENLLGIVMPMRV